MCRQSTCTIQGISVTPFFEGFLTIQENDLDAMCVFKRLVEALHLHCGPFLRQRSVNAAHCMHDHRTWGCTVDTSDEPFRLDLAVIMGDKSQALDVTSRGPGRITSCDKVLKGNFLALRCRCFGR